VRAAGHRIARLPQPIFPQAAALAPRAAAPNMLGAGADARADARYAPARPPLTIDVHTHIMPESLPDLRARYGCDGWVSPRERGFLEVDGRNLVES
jgi:hypothetical protein